MRRIITPVLLLAVAIAALLTSSYLDNRLHDNLGELADDSTVPPRVGTPLISTRRLTAVLAPPLTDAAFFDTLDEIMASAPPSACLSTTVRGNTVYEANASIQVMPSEALLLASLATAQQALGPDHTFRTSVQSVVPMEDGVVNGDIYLVGGGDPLLLTPRFVDSLGEGQNRLHTPIENLAQNLVDDGLTLITGGVVGDASRYDDLAYVSSWPEEVVDSQNAGTLLALQFNDGWLRYPATQDGSASSGAYSPAEDPPFYAAALFDDMLEARSVVIRRGSRAEAVPVGEAAYNLASIESAPMSAYYQQVIDNRDTETIELLLKEIGRTVANDGSTRAGIQAVETTLAEVGVSATEAQLLQFDASGLDPSNVATCPMFTALLDSDEFRPFFLDLLPTGADPGPLQSRVASVADPGIITALAGGDDGTTVMAGYIDIGMGQQLAFAFIANQASGVTGEDLLELEERIVSHLSTLEGRPSADNVLEDIQVG